MVYTAGEVFSSNFPSVHQAILSSIPAAMHALTIAMSYVHWRVLCACAAGQARSPKRHLPAAAAPLPLWAHLQAR